MGVFQNCINVYLSEIFQSLPNKTSIRDIFLFTDGSVANTNQVIELCKKHKKRNRIFGIGIGTGCSTGKRVNISAFMTLILALVDGISSETGGKAIYVKCEDRMETKVMQIADFSFKPTLTMTSIEFNIGSEVSFSAAKES